MKIEVGENREILLKEVYNGVTLETDKFERFFICMRDGGFEINFNGAKFSAQGTTIIEMP